MQVQHNVASLPRRVRVRGLPGGLAGDLQVEGELAAGELPERPRPPHVQRLGTAQLLVAGGTGADRGVQVQGVGQVQLPMHQRRAGKRHLLVVDGEVQPVGGRRRVSSAVSGMNRPIASSISRSTAATPTLWATGARCRSTCAAASVVRSWEMVSWAIRRAFHPGSVPVTTRFQSRGSRYLSSTAWPR